MYVSCLIVYDHTKYVQEYPDIYLLSTRYILIILSFRDKSNCNDFILYDYIATYVAIANKNTRILVRNFMTVLRLLYKVF